MNEMNQAELIDRYLQGDLGTQELQQFQVRMQADEELRQTVEDTQMAQSLVEHYGLRNEIKAIRAAMQAEGNATLPEETIAPVVEEPRLLTQEVDEDVKAVPMFQWAGRIAAGLTLLIVGFLTIQYTTLSPERLYEEKITSESPYLGLSNRSMEDREDTLADQVRVEYQFGNYEEVIRLYGELENPTFAETFRAGYAYLQQERTEQAIDSFQQVMQDEDAFMIKDKAEYYLALAYLQDGQIETAVSMLEKIHESDDHIYEDSLSSFYLWRLRLLKMKY
ncbi:MAG: tetratricopeptide repeat protein [Cyclobacteriaceae bacterium]